MGPSPEGADHFRDTENVDGSEEIVGEDREPHFRSCIAEPPVRKYPCFMLRLIVRKGCSAGTVRSMFEDALARFQLRRKSTVSSLHCLQESLIDRTGDAPAASMVSALRSQVAASAGAGRVACPGHAGRAPDISTEFPGLEPKGQPLPRRTPIAVSFSVEAEIFLCEETHRAIDRRCWVWGCKADALILTMVNRARSP